MKTLSRTLLVALALVATTAAPAMASSTDDCKNGGYANWRPAVGAEPFRNQGQCVSFVARGGRLVPLVPVAFRCSSWTTRTGDSSSVTLTVNCTGASSLYISAQKDTIFAVVNSDGTASFAGTFECSKLFVTAFSFDETERYFEMFCP